MFQGRDYGAVFFWTNPPPSEPFLYPQSREPFLFRDSISFGGTGICVTRGLVYEGNLMLFSKVGFSRETFAFLISNNHHNGAYECYEDRSGNDPVSGPHYGGQAIN